VRSSLVVVGVVALVAAGCSGGGSDGDDPPRIERWSEIGSVRIGDDVDRVRSVYGEPVETDTLRMPVGTRYAGRDVRRDVFSIDGGDLLVTYVDDVVGAVLTDSARYKTDDGIAVGRSVSRGPCRRNSGGGCEYRWRAFYFDECGNAWVGTSDDVQVEIGMERNLRDVRRARVAWIRFGDPHVVLHCF
jgi:hypothetical protein